MNDFETKVLSFVKPIISGEHPVQLDQFQSQCLAAWLTLITMLAEAANSARRRAISGDDLEWLMKSKEPPRTWVIYLCSTNARLWKKRYKYHNFLRVEMDVAGYVPPSYTFQHKDSQLTSMGVGRLMAVILSTPHDDIRAAFHDYAGFYGMERLWPTRLQLFRLRPRFLSFPTKTILDEDIAELISDKFYVDNVVDLALMREQMHLIGAD